MWRHGATKTFKALGNFSLACYATRAITSKIKSTTQFISVYIVFSRFRLVCKLPTFSLKNKLKFIGNKRSLLKTRFFWQICDKGLNILKYFTQSIRLIDRPWHNLTNPLKLNEINIRQFSSLFDLIQGRCHRISGEMSWGITFNNLQ